MRESSAALEPLQGPREELIGDEIDGRFRVLERIGGGGMGSIFRVEHCELRREFAMKVLKAELSRDAAMVERFRREARIAASLTSEHVVAIVDSGILGDGRPYYVMDLLIGSDLRRLLGAYGTLAPARVANLGIDVCRGLATAHAVALIHRDLKPENLFVTRGDDGRDVCKILDFGVAKAGDIGTTRPGTLVGTVRYMAPEQIGLDAPVGPRTDLHAVGVILYECLCGATPFEGDTTERVLYGIVNNTPIPLAERLPELPPGLARVIGRAFARRPEERYPNALALAEALLPFAAGRRASSAGAAWVDLGTAPAAPGGRHSTPALDAEPTTAGLASRQTGPEPQRSTFPWRLAAASVLTGALVTGLLGKAFDRGPSPDTVSPRSLGALERPERQPPDPQPNAAVPTAGPPADPAGALKGAAARSAPLPRPALRPAPPATGAPPKPAATPAPSYGLPPRSSFDAENPYAK